MPSENEINEINETLDQEALQAYYQQLVGLRNELIKFGQGLSAQVQYGIFGEGIRNLYFEARPVMDRVVQGWSENIEADLQILAGFTAMGFGPTHDVAKSALLLCSLPEGKREQLNQYIRDQVMNQTVLEALEAEKKPEDVDDLEHIQLRH
ncbi:MAG: hypothetical protein K0U29_02305 [Gammaproteobacteria bacterium]|nr:hypothetical protein [Gammaproteobacteria bacterium]MCH9743742.1 hypothetical protein [Gammaproteobacteria bacterium]